MIKTITLLYLCGLAIPLFAQISQTHPELCGRPNGSVPFPATISATVDRFEGTGELTVTPDGGSAPVTIQYPRIVEDIKEACPLSDGRVVLFAEAGHVTNILIVDTKNAVVSDSFYTITPVMSPDQRWLVYQKFYPRHTELPVSEEYLLYDFTKSAAQNRAEGIRLDDFVDVGQPIFPLGQKNIEGDNIDVAPSQQHASGFDFYWAPDSKAVMFADTVQKRLQLVLVTIDSTGQFTARTHVLPVTDVCPGPAEESTSVTVRHAEITADMGGLRSIQIALKSFYGACRPIMLDDTPDNFTPAVSEIHTPKKPTAKMVEGH